jgi:hypothetical protein
MKTRKKILLFVLPAVAVIFISLTAFNYLDSVKPASPPSGDNLTIPENVSNIFDNKCFGCHNTDSKNDKAKEKLLIDKLTGLPKAKLIAKLDKISEMVEENKMPPEKFLAKNPDKALTTEESKQLKDWASEASGSLLKK